MMRSMVNGHPDLPAERVQRRTSGPAGSRPFDALLCDIDGVLRHWPSDSVFESTCGLAPGAFAATAYAPQRLLPAITGRVTDEQWRESVAVGLVADGHFVTAVDALGIVAHWSSLRPRVDEDVLALLRAVREIVPVVLVSNATTRLESDLTDQGLGEFVADLVNTSRIGFAKPDSRVYAYAASRAAVPAGRCLFVDDTRRNVEAARDAGMTGVHFREPADLVGALRPLLTSSPRSPPTRSRAFRNGGPGEPGGTGFTSRPSAGG